MLTLPQQLPAPDEVFPPELCPVCGYSLQGLPGEGVCPECGNTYDSSEWILYGWARGPHASSSNSSRRRFVLSLLPSGAWIVMLCMLTRAGGFFGLRAVVVMAWLGSVALALVKRRAVTDHPGRIQVRINKDGIVQIDDLRVLRDTEKVAQMHRVAWYRLTLVTAKSTGEDRFRLKLKRMYRHSRLIHDYPVDAELSCAGEQAKKLDRLVREWLAQARDG